MEKYLTPYKKILKEISKGSREKQTEAEKCHWERLRLNHMGVKFYRQKPVGEYIVDFYCPKSKIIVEIDGAHHFTKEGKGNDKVRDEYIHNLGFEILRFSNSEVLKNPDKVAAIIHDKIHLCPSTKSASILLYKRRTNQRVIRNDKHES